MAKAQQDRLSYAIVQHLQDLTECGAITGDAAESLAVACQCLSEALGVDTSPASQQTLTLKVDKPLQDIFDTAYPAPVVKKVTKDEEAAAVKLKDQGNELMKQNKYEEAIEKYTEALDIVPNAIFYCNRAAAYSKVTRHSDAVSDAKSALALDPNYSKAYTRMGFAYLNMNQFNEAKECYQKACDLDPTNQSYKDNLEAVKEKMASGGAAPGPGAVGTGMAAPPGMPGMPNLAGMDFSQVLNNPAFMNMAQQFMQDPNMQQAFTQMADQFLQAGGVGAGGFPGAPGQVPENLDVQGMLNNDALRNMAETFARNNPDTMDHIRGAGQNNPNNPPADDQSPPEQ